MSLGYLGKAKKIIEDETAVVYVYSGENLNDINSKRGDLDLYDGEISIQKSCLEEPEIHQKIKKTASHKKKLVVKRITHVVNVQQYIDSGEISIKQCKNEFSRENCKTDYYIAVRLLGHIFEEYQLNGELPQAVEFIQ